MARGRWSLGVVLGLVAAACQVVGGGDAPGSGAALLPAGGPDVEAVRPVALADCDAYRRRLAEGVLTEALTSWWWNGLAVVEGRAEGVLALDEGGTGEPRPERVSGTNVQEEGVDELDRIEASTSGDLYVATHTGVVVLDAFPPERLRIRARRVLGWPVAGIYLDEANGALVVLGYTSGEQGPETRLAFLDPGDLAVRTRWTLPGWYLGSRRIAGRLHVVTQMWPRLDGVRERLYARYREEFDRLQELAYAAPGSPGTQVLHERLVAALLAELPPAEVLVPVLEHDGDRYAVACTSVYAPRGVEVVPRLVLVHSLDTDGSDLATIALLTEGGFVYANRDALYLVQTSGRWWWWGGLGFPILMAPTRSRPDPVDAGFRPATLVQDPHGFATALVRLTIGSGPARPTGVALVPGWVWDPYQISEHEGWLRLFTTRWDARWRPETDLYVLATTADPLPLVGAVTGIAPGEAIQAARFLGERAFLITFRRVDPLFAFDLRDPRRPRLVGELTIPGFGTYVHPVDADHLLTIGVDGDTSGNVGGVAVSLFDVSELADPRLLVRFVPTTTTSWTWSPALFDPHAFLYDPPTGLLAFPYVESPWDDGFVGVLVLAVDVAAPAIEERGRVDHADLVPPEACADRFVCDWSPLPRRTALMAAADGTIYLYTVSWAGVKASRADAPEVVVGRVELAGIP